MTKEERQIEQGLRLQKFYNSLNLKGNAFANKIGVTQSLISAVSAGKKPITHQLIDKITECYPNFNEGWLRTGYGRMEFTTIEINEPAVEYRNAWDVFDLLKEKMAEYERRIKLLEIKVEELERGSEGTGETGIVKQI